MQVATCMVCLSLVAARGGQRLAACQHLLKPTWRRSPDHHLLDELPAKERIIATSRGSNQDKLVAAGEMANYGSCWWPELILPPSSSLCRRTRCHRGSDQLSSLRYCGGRGRPPRLLGLNGPIENAARRLVGHFLGTYPTASLPCKARA